MTTIFGNISHGLLRDPLSTTGPIPFALHSVTPMNCSERLRNMTLGMDANITAIKRDMYSIAVPVYVAICVLVTIVNGTVLGAATAIKNSAKEHPTLPLTLSLAVADLWTSVAMGFSFVYNSYLFYVFGIHANACVSLAFEALRTGGLITGSLHLLALAIIHYLTIRYPTSYQNLVTSKSNWVAIFLIWLAPPMSFFIFMSSLPGQFFRSPYIPCLGYCLKMDLWHTLEFRLTIFFAFFSPFILVSLLYMMFLILFRRQERKFSRHASSNLPVEQEPRRHSSLRKQKSQRQLMQKNRRTFTTTLLIWFTFMLGWMPACSMFVLTCQTCPIPFPRETIENVRAVFVLSVISNLFILCKSLINPIIYAIRIPEIKMALSKRYGRCFGFFHCDFRPTPFANAAVSQQNPTTQKGCSFRQSVGVDYEIDKDGSTTMMGKGNEFNCSSAGSRRNRKPKSGQRIRKPAGKDVGEIENHLLQEGGNLLKNNGIRSIDCEMYENHTALVMDGSGRSGIGKRAI